MRGENCPQNRGRARISAQRLPHEMRFAAAAALFCTVRAQGAAGPIWSPPGGNAGRTYCGGASGPASEASLSLSPLPWSLPRRTRRPAARACARACPRVPAHAASRRAPRAHCNPVFPASAASNLTAVYSLGAGAGQPWTPATSVAVAPYGQITFFTTGTGANPILVSLNSAGGQNNFRNDICAFYFNNCSAAVPGTQQTAAAPVTDALRVYVGASECGAIECGIMGAHVSARRSSLVTKSMACARSCCGAALHNSATFLFRVQATAQPPAPSLWRWLPPT
jgi:hypothetical protein